MEHGSIAISQVAQEVRFEVALRKEFFVSVLVAFPSSKKLLVDFGVIEAGHRPTINAHCTRCENQVAPLQGRIAPGSCVDQFRRAGEVVAHAGVVRKRCGQLFEVTGPGFNELTINGQTHRVVRTFSYAASVGVVVFAAA